MPTRHGWTVAGAALLAFAVGRVFGIVELFVIAAAFAGALVVALVGVRIRRIDLDVERWAHPPVLGVGETGRVELTVTNRSAVRSPEARLVEPVGPASSATMTIAPLPGHATVTAGYRVPTARRGVLTLGPALVERTDVLGLARSSRTIGTTTEVTVAPDTIDVDLPRLGRGPLGRHLAAVSARTGPGEFHSLREYAPGDELRSIHWRASARAGALKVRRHEPNGVRRCTVILDRDTDSYGHRPDGDPGSDPFEVAVSVAASLVLAADRNGLTTRFLTGGGIDLHGPDVANQVLVALAPVIPGPPCDEPGRDPGEGLGLVVVVTSAPHTGAWRRAQRSVDPTSTCVAVFAGSDRPSDLLSVAAPSLDAFRQDWQRLVGVPT